MGNVGGPGGRPGGRRPMSRRSHAAKIAPTMAEAIIDVSSAIVEDLGTNSGGVNQSDSIVRGVCAAKETTISRRV